MLNKNILVETEIWLMKLKTNFILWTWNKWPIRSLISLVPLIREEEKEKEKEREPKSLFVISNQS